MLKCWTSVETISERRRMSQYPRGAEVLWQNIDSIVVPTTTHLVPLLGTDEFVFLRDELTLPLDLPLASPQNCAMWEYLRSLGRCTIFPSLIVFFFNSTSHKTVLRSKASRGGVCPADVRRREVSAEPVHTAPGVEGVRSTGLRTVRVRVLHLPCKPLIICIYTHDPLVWPFFRFWVKSRNAVKCVE